MKQFTVIVFMGIYLLSLAGNSLYLEYLMLQSDIEQNSEIDKGTIQRESLVEMKIPFNAPYYSSTPGYERFYGGVNIDGHYYTYVERKVSNDTIYLLCLPDHQKTKLKKAKTQLELQELGVAEKTQDKKETRYSKRESVDYDNYSFALLTEDPSKKISKFIFSYTTAVGEGVYPVLFKPPCSIMFI